MSTLHKQTADIHADIHGTLIYHHEPKLTAEKVPQTCSVDTIKTMSTFELKIN